VSPKSGKQSGIEQANDAGSHAGIADASESHQAGIAVEKADSKDTARSGSGRRRIEAIRERQELRESLGDIFDDNPEIDDEIFGQIEKDERYFAAPPEDLGEVDSAEDQFIAGDMDDIMDDETPDETDMGPETG
jgi:hypothetical protein